MKYEFEGTEAREEDKMKCHVAAKETVLQAELLSFMNVKWHMRSH